MTTISAIENEAGWERILKGNVLVTRKPCLEDGLSIEQRLCCANHSNEEVVLDKIGWKNFICPKCGHDYSIGRKIVILNHFRRKV